MDDAAKETRRSERKRRARVIGGRVRNLRAGKDMTQPDLADAAGLSMNVIARLETAVTLPRDENIEKIARVLGTTAENLKRGIGDDAVGSVGTQVPNVRALGGEASKSGMPSRVRDAVQIVMDEVRRNPEAAVNLQLMLAEDSRVHVDVTFPGFIGDGLEDLPLYTGERMVSNKTREGSVAPVGG